jgi:hypothetical protein
MFVLWSKKPIFPPIFTSKKFPNPLNWPQALKFIAIEPIAAFFFYLWLCVVSHFQVLRAFAKMEEDVNKSVVPFVQDDDDVPYRPGPSGAGLPDFSCHDKPKREKDILKRLQNKPNGHKLCIPMRQ